MKKTISKWFGIISLPFIFGCEPDYPKTELGLMVDTKEEVDYNALDCYFLYIEKKLGYENTSKNLIIEIREAKSEIRDDGTAA